MRTASNIGRNKRSVDEENPYWISFSDILSGLLVIFILATLILMLELSQTRKKVEIEIEELKKVNDVRTEILHEIKDELKNKYGINVTVEDNKSVLRIPADKLHFSQGKYEIPKDKLSSVKNIGKVLFDTITRDERQKYINTIFIEGHTDSVSADKLKLGNWGLSTRRAITVWDYWRKDVEYGVQFSQLRNIEGQPLVSVSGYADTRRVEEDDDTDEKNVKTDELIFVLR